MAREWCFCEVCNCVMWKDGAMWKGDKPYCPAHAPKGAKLPEPVEEFEPVTTTTDDVLAGGEYPPEDEINDCYTGG